MAIDRRLLFNVDWGLLGAGPDPDRASAWPRSSPPPSRGRNTGLEVKQLYAIALGLVGMLVVVSLDYRRLVDRAPVLYLAAVGVLVYVLVFGPRIAGTRRWFMGPGGFQVQPSEFAKLVAALLVAKLFAEAKKETWASSTSSCPGAAVGLMVVLIAAEPDLGTAFTLVPLFLTVAFLAGLRLRAILGVVLVMVVVGSLGWMFALKEYQKSRIYTSSTRTSTPGARATRRSSPRSRWARAAWRARATSRARRASSGTCPRATPTSSSRCSRRRTGSWAWSRCSGCTCSSCGAPSRPRRWPATAWARSWPRGIAAILSFQVIYNVAMVAGLVPVKGLPLPLMSYGGSSVLSSLFAVGLILNVRMRRFAN